MQKKIVEINYKVHLVYGFALFFSIFVIISYMVWSKYQIIFQNEERKIKIANCMSIAKKNYDNSIAALCSNGNKNCDVVIAVAAPKLLDPIINTLNKEQEICVKMVSL
ncbi:MAG: hypothetical protein A3F12_02785 [Gammaproteobacteria bacterium RIFCSPHIGHO2_12_FULL_38_14]|nr:MAG: hypothetical protein A3F12_02785 [Gammaproteobacteria bacterium RIFCSPHIGHO2_12_FULL_38_14]